MGKQNPNRGETARPISRRQEEIPFVRAFHSTKEACSAGYLPSLERGRCLGGFAWPLRAAGQHRIGWMNGGAKSFCEAKNSWEPSKAKAQFRRRELPYSTVISSVSRFGYCEACQQPDRSYIPYYAKIWKMFTKKVLPMGYFIISSNRI